MKTIIKKHCKLYKEKFEKVLSSDMFLSSKLIPIKAGMEKNLITGEYTKHYKIQTIGKKRIYYINKVHSKTDVQLIKTFTLREQAEKMNIKNF